MKKPTWKQLIQVVEDQKVVGFLDSTPEEWKPAIALALSVAKWSPKRGNKQGAGGSICGLCAHYCSDSTPRHCEACPVYLNDGDGGGCGGRGSLWSQWLDVEEDEGESKRVANTLYNLLVELYKKEYYR
jgi:hypothetical protein